MTIQLNANTRAVGEKMKGMIPAVMYGKRSPATPIFINAIAFEKAYKDAGESTVIDLVVNGKNENVLINDIQFDPVKGHIIHADLYVIEKGQKVHVNLPLEFVGESFAVKNLGANLVRVLHEISISADPTQLPSKIVVDISVLAELNSNILVKDIQLPAGVELYHMNADDVVASVVAQVEEDLTAAPTVDMSAIEVEKKGKKEEESEAK